MFWVARDLSSGRFRNSGHGLPVDFAYIASLMPLDHGDNTPSAKIFDSVRLNTCPLPDRAGK